MKNSLQCNGGWDMDGSSIMFVNGDVDPWAELSTTRDKEAKTCQ